MSNDVNLSKKEAHKPKAIVNPRTREISRIRREYEKPQGKNGLDYYVDQMGRKV
jgi:hypothetical protein